MFRLVLLAVLAATLMACADSPGVTAQPESAQPTSDPTTPADLPTGPIPVEPDGGIGDGAGLPAQPTSDPTTPAADLPTGPIPVEPDGGIGDGAGLPAQPGDRPTFGVSSETDSAAVTPFAFCLPSGDAPVLCTDGLAQPDVELSATAQLVVTFEAGELSAQSSTPLGDDNRTPEQEPLPLVEENPGIWLVDVSSLDPGTHTIWLSWNDGAGLDAQAVLDVTRQA